MSGFGDLITEEQEVIEEVITTKDTTEPITNHIAFVMDHSGSMSNLAEVSRTNFNEQLAQIKKDSGEQENFVTLIEFDNEIKTRCRNKHIDTIKDLDTYWIGGMTALYDATMQAIWGIESDMPKDGNHAALVVIITDGYENASQENGGEKGRKALKERIQKLQDSGKWTFVFMGSDQDVLETAVEDMGIHVNNTMAYASTAKGIGESNKAYKMSYDNYSMSRKNSGTTGMTGTTGFFGTSGTNGSKDPDGK
jgi:hypothetical protein